MKRKILALLIGLLVVGGIYYFKDARYSNLSELSESDLDETKTFKGSLKQVARHTVGTFFIYMIIDDGTENAVLAGEWINNQIGDISSFLNRDDLETLPLPDSYTGEHPGIWVIDAVVIDFTTGDLSTEFGVDIGLGVMTWHRASWWE